MVLGRSVYLSFRPLPLKIKIDLDSKLISLILSESASFILNPQP